MRLKNCDGKRIKSCNGCSYVYMDIMGGNLGCKLGCDTWTYNPIIPESSDIPIECRLPDWERTLEVKLE